MPVGPLLISGWYLLLPPKPQIWGPLPCIHLTSSPINEEKLWVYLPLRLSLDLFSVQLSVVLSRNMVRLLHNHPPRVICRVDDGSFLEMDILGGVNICCDLLGSTRFLDS
jgi:hypothetical protein